MEPSEALATEYSGRANDYARYWGPVIHPMAHPLLSTMPLAEARRILDVGTGSGALWPFVQTLAPRAQLWGVDRAHGMLRAGGHSVRGRVAVMDAEHLGVRPAAFDSALLVFVLFHIPDPVCALTEVRAVLRPGGSVGVVSWGEDPGLPGAAIWAEELDRVNAVPDSRDPSVMRQSSMDTPEKLASLFTQAGLDSTQVWSRRFAHEWTVDELIATQTHCGVASRRLSSLSSETRQLCTDGVRVRLGALAPAELVYHVEIVYGIAHRQ